MEKRTSNIIFFLSGTIIGGVSTFFAVKGHFEAKADKEVESVKEAYEKRLEAIDIPKESINGDIKGPDVINDAEPGMEVTKSSIVRELNNKPPLKDYTKFFTGKDEKTLEVKEVTRDPSEDMIEMELAESESPEDDSEMTEEEDMEAQADYEMYKLNEDHKKALEENRPPYVIDLSDFEMTCSHYFKETLHYYIHDRLVATDDDEIINVPDALGDCLDTSGFSENGDDLLYVRNDRLMVDYEIDKVFTAFGGEH